MALEINDIKELKIFNILENYKGKNPYIYSLKKKWEKSSKKLKFTKTQLDYIINYHQKDPIKLGRVMEITDFFGKELKKNENISFVPSKILIEYLLAETDKAYHIFGKIKQNQVESKMYWVPKTQLLDDPYFEEVDITIDFDKYVKLDKFKLPDGTIGRIPYEHQKESCKFFVSRGSSILAAEMGTGKSYISIISALEIDAKKILVVCPASLKYNWEREIESFTDEVKVVEGKNWCTSRFTIINYDILKNFHTLKPKNGDNENFIFNSMLVSEKFDLIICDEAHFLKNPDSNRAKILNEVASKIKDVKVWLLTGTPIANRPMDFFNLLKLIKAPIANNWKNYAIRYCEAKSFFKRLKNGRKRQIWLTDGASNLDELYKRTKNNMLRLRADDVLDMPDRIITPRFHNMSEIARKKYDALWDAYINKRKSEGKRIDNIEKELVELGMLRKHMAMENINNTIDITETALNEDKKIVIFCNFTDELLALQAHFGKKCVIHNGSMSAKEKQNSVDKFQTDDKIKVFIGNIISAGAGITLTKGTVCVFNSLDWVPGNVMQALFRCYRIGQTKKVFIYFNIFKNTVDERVWNTLGSKTNVISQAVGDNTEDNIFNVKTEGYINSINNIIGNVD